jgi:hypothetical protein
LFDKAAILDSSFEQLNQRFMNLLALEHPLKVRHSLPLHILACEDLHYHLSEAGPQPLLETLDIMEGFLGQLSLGHFIRSYIARRNLLLLRKCLNRVEAVGTKGDEEHWEVSCFRVGGEVVEEESHLTEEDPGAGARGGNVSHRAARAGEQVLCQGQGLLLSLSQKKLLLL